MHYLYAPGCALMAYKPELAALLKQYAEKRYGSMETVLKCCFDKPSIPKGCTVVTPCATCAERYAGDSGCSVICLLNDLAVDTSITLPDYGGVSMSIQDTCAARKQPEVLNSVRVLARRMNINISEPQFTGIRARCCGQVFYGKLEEDKVTAAMKRRAGEMPCNDVITYCASCIMSMTVGGRSPRFITDLIFGEPTVMTGITPAKWNNGLAEFRASHINDEVRV